MTTRLGSIAVILALVAVLPGCGSPHDMSLNESCNEYKTLTNNPSAFMTHEKYEVQIEDLLAAEPNMHESVARQVRDLTSINPMDDYTDEEFDRYIAAFLRLDELCG